MKPERTYRWAEPRDDAVLGEVMFDAVRNGESRYSERERAAWVDAPRVGPAWSARLAAQHIILAEDGTGILGFMSLAPGGYIDFAYIRPEARGNGLFRTLMAQIEGRALANNERRLWTHASLMAEPAFRAVGFDVVAREVVELNGERFDRAEMRRELR